MFIYLNLMYYYSDGLIRKGGVFNRNSTIEKVFYAMFGKQFWIKWTPSLTASSV